MEENKNSKPKHLIIFKILGLVFAGVAIVGFIKLFKGFGNFETNDFMVGGFMSTFGMFLAITFLVLGFKPEMARMSARSTQYIQQQNKDTFTNIASTQADIVSEAINKTTRAIKKGIKDIKFCKHCGAEIDADSKFCNNCGGEQ